MTLQLWGWSEKAKSRKKPRTRTMDNNNLLPVPEPPPYSTSTNIYNAAGVQSERSRKRSDRGIDLNSNSLLGMASVMRTHAIRGRGCLIGPTSLCDCLLCLGLTARRELTSLQRFSIHYIQCLRLWLRKVCSCSCIPVLPGFVWVLLSKI